MFKKYRTGELLDYLGVSRDTLRFYEEKGLLSPQKNNENNYRGYDIYNIYKIMIIDFYKKRGLTIQQIQDLLKKSDLQDMQSILENKKNELEKIINDGQRMLKRIEDTQKFSRELGDNLNKFTVKPLPLYMIKGEVSDFIAVEEYKNVIDIMNSNNDDMLSQILRYISFDANGVTGTKMLIVDAAGQMNGDNVYLQYPKCLYTVAEETQPNIEQVDLMEKMHRYSTEYANEHGLKLLGEAFAMIRLITHKVKQTQSYIEIYIPFD